MDKRYFLWEADSLSMAMSFVGGSYIYNHSGKPFGLGPVDEAAFAEEVDPDAAWEPIFVDENNLGPGDGPNPGEASFTP